MSSHMTDEEWNRLKQQEDYADFRRRERMEIATRIFVEAMEPRGLLLEGGATKNGYDILIAKCYALADEIIKQGEGK